MLSELKRKVITDKKTLPFVYNYYNISCYTASPDSLNNNVLARIVNCVIKALNDAARLPRIILVILDWDIINFVDFSESGIRMTSHAAIYWITNQIARAIAATKDNIRCKKPGVIISSEPKVIWLQTFNRNDNDDAIDTATKFNSMMSEVLSAREHHYVMNISSKINGESLYDSRNEINGFGEVRMWQEIDLQLELFDKKKLTLKPFAVKTHDRERNRESSKKKHRNSRDSSPEFNRKDDRGHRECHRCT